jgi:hypothetical protein
MASIAVEAKILSSLIDSIAEPKTVQQCAGLAWDLNRLEPVSQQILRFLRENGLDWRGFFHPREQFGCVRV